MVRQAGRRESWLAGIPPANNAYFAGTLGFREYVGDYQRQLFLLDHAGLPLTTVLEQLDLLGQEVVPVLREETAARTPAHVPAAPTHASQRGTPQQNTEVNPR